MSAQTMKGRGAILTQDNPEEVEGTDWTMRTDAGSVWITVGKITLWVRSLQYSNTKGGCVVVEAVKTSDVEETLGTLAIE
jgi:hypothetical protein